MIVHRSGLEVAADFYARAVAPAVERDYPPQRYAAVLAGPGSEVLGFDDARSTDHDWGPRLQVLLADGSPAAELDDLWAALDDRLPEEFAGRPVRFARSHDPVVRHRVEVTTRHDWFRTQIGFDPLEPLDLTSWLGVPTYRLAEVTGGRVFHDPGGELIRSRERLRWYPPDGWRWVLARQWHRLAEAEAFPGRCAERGDLLGVGVLVGRIVEAVMRRHSARCRYPAHRGRRLPWADESDP